MQKYDYTLEYKPEGSYYSQTYCPVHQFLKQQNDNNMEEEKMHSTVIWYSQAYHSQNPNLKKNERKQPTTSRWHTSVKSSNVDGQEQTPVSVTVPACIGTWEIECLNWTVLREHESRDEREMREQSTRCVIMAWDEFWNSGKDCKMQYMPTTPKAKSKGANDSLPITKQALGKGSNRPVHLG